MANIEELIQTSKNLEQKSNDIKDVLELENTLLELFHTYEWLNFYKEDSYLIELTNTAKRLVNFYVDNNKEENSLNFYISAIECYNDLLLKDKENHNYIMELKEVYNRYKDLVIKLNKVDNVINEYPQIKKYLDI